MACYQAIDLTRFGPEPTARPDAGDPAVWVVAFASCPDLLPIAEARVRMTTTQLASLLKAMKE